MNPWMYLLIAIPVVALFVCLLKASNKASANSRKVLTAKWSELQAALRETHTLFGQKQVTNVEAIDLLIDAATHLAPANWMVSTRRIIGAGDYVQHYGEGLELVKQARAKAGV